MYRESSPTITFHWERPGETNFVRSLLFQSLITERKAELWHALLLHNKTKSYMGEEVKASD